MTRRPPRSPLFPYTPPSRSEQLPRRHAGCGEAQVDRLREADVPGEGDVPATLEGDRQEVWRRDRKSTRLNSSHSQISYAVFCLKKKKKRDNDIHHAAIQRQQ